MNDPKANLRYLQETVVPFIEKMPQVEDSPGSNQACFDLNAYIGTRSCLRPSMKPDGRRAFPEKISDKYDCGFVGCLAGWYVMMSRQDGRIDNGVLKSLEHFQQNALADHFDIEEAEVYALFGTRNCGVELINACNSGMYDDKYEANEALDNDDHSNLDCLHERVELLDDIINDRNRCIDSSEMDI